MSDPKHDPKPKQTDPKISETVEEVPERTRETEEVQTGPPIVTEPDVELDTVLMNEIGDFGKYQLQSFMISILLVIFSGLASMNYIFTTALIPTRCLIRECESERTEFAQEWVSHAVPPGREGYCQRYGRAAPAPREPGAGACPPSLFDRSTRLPCDGYVHENYNSVVYDFGLECQEWWRSMLGMFRKLGTLAALPITSYMSDRFGRRITITFTAFNSAWIGVNRFWMFNYTSFAFLEFIESTFGSGLFSSCYILMIELFGPKYRVAAGVSLHTSFAVGQMVLGAIAWCEPHWRRLSFVLYFPQLFSILSYWIISESVRWYMSKGRFDDSEALLQKMAKMNGRSVSYSSLAGLRRTAEENLRLEDRLVNRRGKQPGLIMQVWRHKRVLLRVIVSPFWWLTTTFVYYGLAINAVSMSGNKYMNYIAVAAVEIPGYWLAYFLLNKIGRKLVLAGGFWVCAACQVAYIFLPQGWFVTSLVVYLVSKSAIATVMTSLYVYTTELYPTNNRHKLLAIASMFGRVGAILAPLTPAFAAQWFLSLPFVLFSGMALLAGALIFLTPETLGTLLPDTFEQAEQLGLEAKR